MDFDSVTAVWAAYACTSSTHAHERGAGNEEAARVADARAEAARSRAEMAARDLQHTRDDAGEGNAQ